MPLPQFFRHCGGVRGDKNILQFPKRRIFRKRFGSKDVQSCSRDLFCLQRSCECSFVYYWAASYVDEISIVAHFRQALCVKQIARSWGERRDDKHVVGTAQEPVQFLHAVYFVSLSTSLLG